MNRFLQKWRYYLIFGGFFSLFINILVLTFPIYMLQIYDRVLSSYSMPTLYVISLAAVVALVVMAVLEFVRSRLLVYCGVAIDQALGHEVLDEVVKQAAAVEQVQDQATLRDVNLLRNFFGGNAVFTLFDIPWTPLFLAVIYLLHPLLGMVATGGVVVLIILAIINERISSKPLEEAVQAGATAMKFAETARRNAQTIRSMGMETGVARRWQQYNNQVMGLQTAAGRRSGTIQAMSSWVRQSMQVFIYGTGAWLTLQDLSTAGSMIAASIIMGRALAPVQMGIGSWKSMIEARGAWRRLDEMLKRRITTDAMSLPEPQGHLTCEHMSFAAAGNLILRDISIDLLPGESLGVVGPSGAGKSTLCRLLLGLWPVGHGSVRLDGADLYSWNDGNLGRYIGYLPQDIELFHGSVADNIARLGQVDSEQVVAAALGAGIHDMILGFPMGYDTPIGEGGMPLSGGQRQRIALARALYGQPRLLILDEPNSNLDEEGERSLIRLWAELKQKGVTLVVVSHKLNLLAQMDKILILKQGQAALYGGRDEVFRTVSSAQPPLKKVVNQSNS